MAVLIEGIEMPTSCEKCQFHDGWCLLLPGIAQAENERREDCPLVPVPKHGDLIDRSKISYFKDDSNLLDFDYAYRSQINSMPTIIPAEEGEA